MALTFLLGGARSGKSELAVRLAANTSGPVVVIATAEARDEEMAERIGRHRRDRPAGWSTIEVPLRLAEAVGGLSPNAVVILDCVSLWVANTMEAGQSDEAIVGEAEEAARVLAGRSASSVVVSNEVGLGIVPVNELARRYRDVLGRVNATAARAADRAYLVVAGRTLPLEDGTLG
jgi:adenosylcobinamide kinase/adenosylcobinamide-phosphate guanylyltransferase